MIQDHEQPNCASVSGNCNEPLWPTKKWWFNMWIIVAWVTAVEWHDDEHTVYEHEGSCMDVGPDTLRCLFVEDLFSTYYESLGNARST